MSSFIGCISSLVYNSFIKNVGPPLGLINYKKERNNSKRVNRNATRGRKSMDGMNVSTLKREERLEPFQNIQYSFKEEGME
jgi:hypothetical protein